jgi:hypothetical protein
VNTELLSYSDNTGAGEPACAINAHVKAGRFATSQPRELYGQWINENIPEEGYSNLPTENSRQKIPTLSEVGIDKNDSPKFRILAKVDFRHYNRSHSKMTPVLRLLMEARLGELIKQEQDAGRLASQDTGNRNLPDSVVSLKDYGISWKESYHAQALAEHKDIIAENNLLHDVTSLVDGGSDHLPNSLGASPTTSLHDETRLVNDHLHKNSELKKSVNALFERGFGVNVIAAAISEFPTRCSAKLDALTVRTSRLYTLKIGILAAAGFVISKVNDKNQSVTETFREPNNIVFMFQSVEDCRKELLFDKSVPQNFWGTEEGG